MLKKILFTTALLGCATSAFSASNRPEGWVTICKTGETCSVSSATNVAFGAADKFVYKILTGSFTCSVATFGSDPIPEKSVKECSISSSGSDSGGGSSSSTPSNSSSLSVSASAGNGSATLNWSNPSNVNALEVYRDGKGVCRDFMHLAVTFCRCLNIPARYVTGYLGDIGVPPAPYPMDFSAWFEVFLGGKWHTFDARHNQRRIGRILMAVGRDAADVALTTNFGSAKLLKFHVITEEVK